MPYETNKQQVLSCFLWCDQSNDEIQLAEILDN